MGYKAGFHANKILKQYNLKFKNARLKKIKINKNARLSKSNLKNSAGSLTNKMAQAKEKLSEM